MPAIDLKIGDVKKTGCLAIESAQAKASTLIAKATQVCNDGNGFVPATASLAATYKVHLALDDVAAAQADRGFRVLVRGLAVAKLPGNLAAFKKGRKFTVGTTAGNLVLASSATDIIVCEAYEDTVANATEAIVRY